MAQAKTREEQQAARRAELEYFAQMEAARQAERAEKQREHDEFAARVQARRDAIDTHIRRSWAQRSDEPMSEAQLSALSAQIEQEAFASVKASGTIPTWDELYAAKRAEEQAAREQAEAERIAALTPRDIWLTTLPWQERERVSKWEAVNKGQKYPIPLSALGAIKAARAAEQETP